MLSEALETIRGLVDEAIASDESQAAAKLSRLSSALEKAVSYQRQIGEKYIARAEIDRSTVELIEAYIAIAETVLPPDIFAVFEAAMNAALPSPIAEDDYVTSLRKERDQVAELFASAVEARLVGDITKMGNLLCTKIKAQTRAEVHAGVLLDADAVSLLVLPILDANKTARKAIGEDWHNVVIDLFAPLDPTGGASDGG